MIIRGFTSRAEIAYMIVFGIVGAAFFVVFGIHLILSYRHKMPDYYKSSLIMLFIGCLFAWLKLIRSTEVAPTIEWKNG